MLRKPLLRDGVRLCCNPMLLIQSGDSDTTSSSVHPLNPCTNKAARPCRSAMSPEIQHTKFAQNAFDYIWRHKMHISLQRVLSRRGRGTLVRTESESARQYTFSSLSSGFTHTCKRESFAHWSCQCTLQDSPEDTSAGSISAMKSCCKYLRYAAPDFVVLSVVFCRHGRQLLAVRQKLLILQLWIRHLSRKWAHESASVLPGIRTLQAHSHQGKLTILKRSTIFFSSTGKSEVTAVAWTADTPRLLRLVDAPCHPRWTVRYLVSRSSPERQARTNWSKHPSSGHVTDHLQLLDPMSRRLGASRL